MTWQVIEADCVDADADVGGGTETRSPVPRTQGDKQPGRVEAEGSASRATADVSVYHREGVVA